MDTQSKLNAASALGNTISGLLKISSNNSAGVQQSVDALITSLSAKAQSLLVADELKITVSGPADVAEVVRTYNEQGLAPARELLLTDGGLNPALIGHYSDCATNNTGVPELAGPCDCKDRLGPTVPSDFEAELDRGTVAAKAVVEHALAMGSNGCKIPVTFGGMNYEVFVRHVPTTIATV